MTKVLACSYGVTLSRFLAWLAQLHFTNILARGCTSLVQVFLADETLPFHSLTLSPPYIPYSVLLFPSS